MPCWARRYWLHTTVNVFARLPKELQFEANDRRHAVQMAARKKEAWKAYDHLLARIGSNEERECVCLVKDRAGQMTFDKIPGNHWHHLRTANVSKSRSVVILHRDRQLN